MPTRRSGVVIGPMSSRSACRWARTAAFSGKSTGCSSRVNTSQAIGSITKVTGMPTSIHRAKLISMP